MKGGGVICSPSPTPSYFKKKLSSILIEFFAIGNNLYSKLKIRTDKKSCYITCYMLASLVFCDKEMSKNPPPPKKKFIQIEEKNFHVFWTTWWLLMKSSGKM